VAHGPGTGELASSSWGNWGAGEDGRELRVGLATVAGLTGETDLDSGSEAQASYFCGPPCWLRVHVDGGPLVQNGGGSAPPRHTANQRARIIAFEGGSCHMKGRTRRAGGQKTVEPFIAGRREGRAGTCQVGPRKKNTSRTTTSFSTGAGTVSEQQVGLCRKRQEERKREEGVAEVVKVIAVPVPGLLQHCNGPPTLKRLVDHPARAMACQ